ncbi:MAG: DUF3798 domain-containing protein [Dysgonamonadaceae bacterium]|nr:DUF3798 domain-containing protein [Dysgonamonadaceae bacterium]
MKKIKQNSAIRIFFGLVLVFLFAACNPRARIDANKPESRGEGRGTKIGIMCSPLEWGEENYRMVERILAEFGKDKFIVNIMPADGDVQTIVSLASKMANDPDCGVIVFNEAAVGCIAGMQAVREINPNILLITIMPGEDPVEIENLSDLVAQQAFEELGASVVDAANEKGLKVLVFEVPADQLGTTMVQRRLAGLKARCDELGIKLIETTLPSQTDANNRPALEQAAKEDVYSKIAQYGENVGFFPHTSFIYIPMITAMLDKKAGYLVLPCDAGPFSPAYSDAFKISAPGGNVLDIAWTNSAIAKKCEEYGMVGRFGNWDFALLSSFMYASVRYGIDYQDGKVGRNDVETLVKYYMEINNVDDTDCFYRLYKREDGTDVQHHAMIWGKIKWYGENLL